MTATDYDAPRRPAADLADDSLEELTARRQTAQSPSADVDEVDSESFELPGADLADEELTVPVVPASTDDGLKSKTKAVSTAATHERFHIMRRLSLQA